MAKVASIAEAEYLAASPISKYDGMLACCYTCLIQENSRQANLKLNNSKLNPLFSPCSFLLQ